MPVLAELSRVNSNKISFYFVTPNPAKLKISFMQRDKLEVEEGEEDLIIVLVLDLLLDRDRVLAWGAEVARMEELRLLGERRERGRNTMSRIRRRTEILFKIASFFSF
jgi:hypothetical protein